MYAAICWSPMTKVGVAFTWRFVAISWCACTFACVFFVSMH
jgi:hypothetical protein